MTRADLIEMVLVKLDEMLPEGQESILLDEPTPINEYIDQLLDEAAMEILLVAPLHVAVNALENVEVEDGEPDYIELPSDYLRINALVLNGWENPVSQLIDRAITPDRYMMARNRYAGAGVNRPAAALSERQIANEILLEGEPIQYTMVKVIEPFPSLQGDEPNTGTLSYVAKKNAEDCDDRLIPIIATHCAQKVASGGGKPNSKYLAEEVQKQLTAANSK